MFRTGAEACGGGASACDCLRPCNGPLRAGVRALNPYGLARALTRKGKSSRQPGEELPGFRDSDGSEHRDAAMAAGGKSLDYEI